MNFCYSWSLTEYNNIFYCQILNLPIITIRVLNAKIWFWKQKLYKWMLMLNRKAQHPVKLKIGVCSLIFLKKYSKFRSWQCYVWTYFMSRVFMMKTNEAKIQVYQIEVCIIVTFHMVYSGLHSIYSLYDKNLNPFSLFFN